LKTFRTASSQLGIISPGEPFHIVEAGIEWLMNWYIVRAYGQTLYGPPPETIIDPIAPAEYVTAVQDHIVTAPDWFEKTADLPWQSYAILTSCRALYTVHHGQQTSKARAAAWAQGQLPEWSETISRALDWRRGQWDPDTRPEATLPETLRFVRTVIARIQTQG
jgi:hypothetical protein